MGQPTTTLRIRNMHIHPYLMYNGKQETTYLHYGGLNTQVYLHLL
jgi:hypothetical protein